MAGIIYGIGVGPGDPELMTLKAVRRLKECDVIALPNKDKESCVAYDIARQAVKEIEHKPCICLPMPMTKDKVLLEKSHDEAGRRIAELLKEGKTVGFITLGDVSIYSTYVYLMDRLRAEGYEVRMEAGIPSFCASASRLSIPLVSGAEELHIIPASYQVTEALKLPGVKVFMKAGSKMAEVKAHITKSKGRAVMVENCGMAGERIYESLEEIPEDAGYYSLLIVR